MKIRRSKPNRRIARAAHEPASPLLSVGGPERKGRIASIALNALLVLAALAIVAGFTFGGRSLAGWLRTSDSFSMRIVKVSGNEKLLEEEVLAQAGIEPKMSMFDLDEHEATSNLVSHPWIREAKVTKHMPDRVIVEIVERELAALVWAEGLWRVDVDGTVFEKHPAGEPVDKVIITGIDNSWIEGDEEKLRSELCKIIQIIDEYERMGLTRLAPVSTVHREHGGGIVLYIGEEAREIRLGQGHMLKKLKRLRAVLRELDGQKRSWDYIMVDSKNFPERLVARLASS